MQQHEVSFFSEGVRLAGTLALPEESRDRYEVVILVHGYANFRDEMGGFAELAVVLAGAGYASLRFDLRGCGASGGLHGHMLPATEWPNDLMAAVSYLQTRPDMDSERIAALGISMGGSTVVHAGGLDERLCCLVSLCPVADGPRWLEWLWTRNLGQAAWANFLACVELDRGRRALTGRSQVVSIPTQILAQTAAGLENWLAIAAQFPEFRSEAPWASADSVLHWRPVDHAGRIAPRPIRFIHGQADPLVPPSEARDLFDHARPTKDLQLIDGADHALLVGPHKGRVQALIMEWLDRFMKQDLFASEQAR